MADDDYIQSHQSGLRLHRQCPQSWYYKYVLKLTEEEDNVAPERDFGSWWSALRAAESTERGRKLDSLKQEPRKITTVNDGPEFHLKDITVEKVLEGAQEWWDKHKNVPDGLGGFAIDQWEERLGGTAPMLLRNLLTRHLDMWGDEIKKEHPLGNEIFWRRKLPQPEDEWVPQGYPDMWLIGFIDEMFWDAERGMVVVRDHKTTKKLGMSSAADDMMESQLQLYAWGVNPKVTRDWGFPKGVQAVTFDRARSVAPRPPSLTKAGKIRTYQGEPSTGMMDLRTYLDWVATEPEYEGLKKDGSGAGVYQEDPKVVEKLSAPAAMSNWFQRAQVPLNKNLIRTHLRGAVDSSYDQWVTRRRAQLTNEAQRNFGKQCSWCPMAALCRAQMIGGSDGYYELGEYGLRGKKGETILDEGQLVRA